MLKHEQIIPIALLHYTLDHAGTMHDLRHLTGVCTPVDSQIRVSN